TCHAAADDLTGTNFAVENLLRQLVFNLALDRTTQRTCAQYWIKASLGQQVLGLLSQLDAHVALCQLSLHAADEQLNHLHDLVASELVEDHNLINTVQELW